jgi:hypothetical protein
MGTFLLKQVEVEADVEPSAVEVEQAEFLDGMRMCIL